MNTLSYKTISANAQTVDKQWVVIDAGNLPLGRTASIAAIYLRGKHKTNFTPHVDCGDNVIVINAEKVLSLRGPASPPPDGRFRARIPFNNLVNKTS